MAEQDVLEQTTFWLEHYGGHVEEDVEICRISPKDTPASPRFVTDETQTKLREAAKDPDEDGQWLLSVDAIKRREEITCSVEPFDDPARAMLREHDRFKVVKLTSGDAKRRIELLPIT